MAVVTRRAGVPKRASVKKTESGPKLEARSKRLITKAAVVLKTPKQERVKEVEIRPKPPRPCVLRHTERMSIYPDVRRNDGELVLFHVLQISMLVGEERLHRLYLKDTREGDYLEDCNRGLHAEEDLMEALRICLTCPETLEPLHSRGAVHWFTPALPISVDFHIVKDRKGKDVLLAFAWDEVSASDAFRKYGDETYFPSGREWRRWMHGRQLRKDRAVCFL